MQALEAQQQAEADAAQRATWEEQNAWMDNYRTAREYEAYMAALEAGKVDPDTGRIVDGQQGTSASAAGAGGQQHASFEAADYSEDEDHDERAAPELVASRSPERAARPAAPAAAAQRAPSRERVSWAAPRHGSPAQPPSAATAAANAAAVAARGSRAGLRPYEAALISDHYIPIVYDDLTEYQKKAMEDAMNPHRKLPHEDHGPGVPPPRPYKPTVPIAPAFEERAKHKPKHISQVGSSGGGSNSQRSMLSPPSAPNSSTTFQTVMPHLKGCDCTCRAALYSHAVLASMCLCVAIRLAGEAGAGPCAEEAGGRGRLPAPLRGQGRAAGRHGAALPGEWAITAEHFYSVFSCGVI